MFFDAGPNLGNFNRGDSKNKGPKSRKFSLVSLNTQLKKDNGPLRPTNRFTYHLELLRMNLPFFTMKVFHQKSELETLNQKSSEYWLFKLGSLLMVYHNPPHNWVGFHPHLSSAPSLGSARLEPLGHSLFSRKAMSRHKRLVQQDDVSNKSNKTLESNKS